MPDIPEEYEDMKPFMTNYKVNLVQASNVAPDNFRTDLRHVFLCWVWPPMVRG